MEKGPITKRRDGPISMRVEPDLYDRLKAIKGKFCLKDLKAAQEHMLQILDDTDRAPPEERIPEHVKAYLDKRIEEEGHSICSAVGTVVGTVMRDEMQLMSLGYGKGGMDTVRGQLGALEDRVKENEEAMLHTQCRIEDVQEELRKSHPPLKVTMTIEGLTLKDLGGALRG